MHAHIQHKHICISISEGETHRKKCIYVFYFRAIPPPLRLPSLFTGTHILTRENNFHQVIKWMCMHIRMCMRTYIIGEKRDGCCWLYIHTQTRMHTYISVLRMESSPSLKQWWRRGKRVGRIGSFHFVCAGRNGTVGYIKVALSRAERKRNNSGF